MSLAIGAGLSTLDGALAAAEAACTEAGAALGDGDVQLAFLFFSAAYAPAAIEITEIAHKILAPRALLGCTAQAVIGGSREVEQAPAVAVWTARLPATSILTFGAEFDPETSFSGFPAALPADATVLMLADPFTFPTDRLLAEINERTPGLQVLGGIASGAIGPGQSRLVLDTEVRNGGAVGAVLSGGVVVRPLVSQGCRPVGSPATVTRADRNVIIELGGQTPLERIRDMFGAADPAERALMQQGLHIGRVIDEYKTEFRRGDFLIRSVMGADPESGAVAVGDYVEVGETVQFHVRDAGSADEDLKTMLATVAQPPAGALLFTCNGRGTYLFGVPDHDARAVQASFGRLPLAGLFCAGEIGPVGGRNFLHGFTASLALFTDA
jgi:small ligand-binding sensory domain FIST